MATSANSGRTEGLDGPVRVYVSCARKDRKRAKKLVRALRKRFGLQPLWDAHAQDGKPAAETRTLIARAHLFMPMLTDNVSPSSAVHREAGHAVALGMPVVPVAVGGVPREFAGSEHCVVVNKKLSDLEERLGAVDFQELVLRSMSPGPPEPIQEPEREPGGEPEREPERAVQPDPAATATVASIVHRAHEGDDALLLTRRASPPFKGKWCLPCGPIARYEEAAHAAARHVKESTGLDFDASFLSYFDEISPRCERHNVIIAFVGAGTGELAADERQLTEVAWHPLFGALSMDLAPTHRRILEAFAEGV